MERHRPRILLADDDTLIDQGCKTFLEPEIEVVAIVNDGRAMIEAALKLRPEDVTLYVSMANLNGLDAGEQLKEKMKSVKLVFLTMHLEPGLAPKAFRRGASAYILKSSAAE